MNKLNAGGGFSGATTASPAQIAANSGSPYGSSELSDFVKNRESLDAIYGRLSNEYNIPGLQQTAQTLTGEASKVGDLLTALPKDTAERTAGQFVSEAQRRRMEAVEGADLREQLAKVGRGLEPIQQQLQTGLQTIQSRLGLISEDREAQLTSLLDKIQEGRRLEQREWDLAQTLASEERAAARARSSAAASGFGPGVSAELYGRTQETPVAVSESDQSAEIAARLAGEQEKKPYFNTSKGFLGGQGILSQLFNPSLRKGLGGR